MNMKPRKVILAAAAALAAALSLGAVVMPMRVNTDSQSSDKEGHVLVDLWSKYSRARSRDLPADASRIAGQIVETASSRHLPWDFYTGWNAWQESRLSRNWKLRDEIEKERAASVEKFGEPVVIFCEKNGSKGQNAVWNWAKGEKDALQKARNPQFYRHMYTSGMMGECLPDYIGNDWEFVLWSLVRGRGNGTSGYEGDEVYAELEKALGGTYPSAAYLEYLAAGRFSDRETRKAKLQAVESKYSGKAIGFYAGADLLQMEFSALEEKSSGEEGYKALLSKCRRYELGRLALEGSEAKMVKDLDVVSDIISTLNSKSLSVVAEDGVARVLFRNVEAADLSITREGDDNAVFSKTVQNGENSFYVIDTVEVKLPSLDDGSYTFSVRKGKFISDETNFSKHTLSLAVRQADGKDGVYVTDYKSGEPLRKVDLTLLRKGRVVAAEKDFPLGDGFTPLPASFEELIGGSNTRCELYASFRDGDIVRRSQNLVVAADWHDRGRFGENAQGRYALLMTDRGAYNPGDTVRFKGVLYSGDLRNKTSVCPAGQKVTVTFTDSEGNRIGTMDLTTNEFGSVAGEFAVPEGVRGGWFDISLKGSGYEAGRGIRVDEFVLPTFDLSFDRNDRLWLPGDTVEVRGKLTSYSGHPLSGAKLRYRALDGETVLGEGAVDQAPDGTFSLSFPTSPEDDWQNCTVTVTVMDETGETQEFSCWVLVSNGINVRAELLGAADGECGTDEEALLAPSDTVRFSFSTKDMRGSTVPVDISYSLRDQSGNVLYSGVAESGSTKEFDLSGRGGLFRMVVSADAGKRGDVSVKDEDEVWFVIVPDDAAELGAPLDYYFRCFGTELEGGENIRMQFGTATGPLWAVAEIYGEKAEVLESRMVVLAGKMGEKGSLSDLEYEYKASWPDAVRFQLFWFRNGERHDISRQVRRVRHSLDLPLSFESFEDETLPGRKYSVRMQTEPGVEAVVSVFDKATERIAPNMWEVVSPWQESAPYVGIDAVCGRVGSENYYYLRRGLRMAKSGNVMLNAASADYAVEEEAMMAAPMGTPMDEIAQDAVPEEDVAVRENFAKSLLWEPFLRSGEDGSLSFDFETSGKLSTFLVQVYAHDKTMHNALVRREMVVTMPVKVSVMEPGYLYSGDKASLAVSVSSIASAPVSGILSLEQDGKTESIPVTVPAGGSVSHSFAVDVPELSDGEAPRPVSFKAMFRASAEDGVSLSDAMKVSVPVYPAAQTLTESHSAVVLAGYDERAILERLRGEFTGTTAFGAEQKTISIIDMVRDALPGKIEPTEEDVLTLSETYYVRLLSESLGGGSDSYELPTAKLLEKILACRNADGGFGWYEGMHSSPVITAVLLERFSKLTGAGLMTPLDLSSSVKYLDDSYFSLDRPFWCGGISEPQYLHVRSLYPQVQFDPQRQGGTKAAFQKKMKDFRKSVREYLVPGEKRGLNGQIFAKARRLGTLWNLSWSPEGIALANSWGVSWSAPSKLRSSLEADVASLLQYAEDHKDGGIYYPNLVMPFRGLLESEAYAHSMLCDLFTAYAAGGTRPSAGETARVADGIRIWLMLQKETQHWDTDPAFVDAIASVMAGGSDVKATKVIALTKTYRKPFSEIKAAGNGFTISRKFMREVSVPDVENPGSMKTERQEIRPGDKIFRGDKIVAIYEIWNGENRSFVRLRAPREACLRPVEQLSGWYSSWRPRPLRIGGWYSFSPSGYRNVRTGETVWSFDSYPEEKTSVSEEFFVTQDGEFRAPAVTIESLYAPHYRANGESGQVLRIEPEDR